MIPLSVAAAFRTDVRARGEAYHRARKVTVLASSPTSLVATVAGSDTYDVAIHREGPALLADCTCPAFEQEPCKHLWACLRAAAERGHLGLAAAKGPLHLVPVEQDAAEFIEDDLDGADDPEGREDDLEGDFRHGHAQPHGTGFGPRPLTASFLPGTTARSPRGRRPGRPVGWKRWLAPLLDPAPTPHPQGVTTPMAPGARVLYAIDVASSLQLPGLVLSILRSDPRKTGGWKAPTKLRLDLPGIAALPDAFDREVLARFGGAPSLDDYRLYHGGRHAEDDLRVGSRVVLPEPLRTEVLPSLARSGRCVLQPVDGGGELEPLAWDEGEPWQFRLALRRHSAAQHRLEGTLRRGAEVMGLDEPALLLASGHVFARGLIARVDAGRSFGWLAHLRSEPSVAVADKDVDRLLAAVVEAPDAPPLDVPEDLAVQEEQGVPQPRLEVQRDSDWSAADRLACILSFRYGSRVVPEGARGAGLFDTTRRTTILRDHAAETAARAILLAQPGVKAGGRRLGERHDLHVQPSALPPLVRALTALGWHVEAEGKLFHVHRSIKMAVTSGIDWLALDGQVAFDGGTVDLASILATLRRGESVVRLGDGSFGMLPERWLARFGPLLGIGSVKDGEVRYKRSQGVLLDALLASQPESSCDATFGRVRREIRRFDGIKAAPQPAGVSGRLRDYQLEGLGWMRFLRGLGMGGCLADDMGVGKTAQVLALLESRRTARDRKGAPSLVVVPKSLVFNWKQEATRFTPRLQVVDHTGLDRDAATWSEADLVLTTYGTLRRDIEALSATEFDYVVLDEAQAIKNADSDTAKAALLLRGRHRLALSGTPIENHLGELWSLFEFLNPGVLGAASVFSSAKGLAGGGDEESRALLKRALRPFILRRTKAQVVKELPPRTEQTIHCELDAPQRRLYAAVRDDLRASLLPLVDRQGAARSQMNILEGLLRLRQVACHAGLVDPAQLSGSSAKVDTLLARLDEVLAEGHAALVFSQFTSLLAIVRRELDARGVVHEYLDGKTVDRAARVERFQTDPACRLFLVSLKAGGTGLNLTRAEYVFLLDPWWNPAVEAQAIDRAHRIGQDRHVFAYRLIARGTVEEKVLELQRSKRELADSLLGEGTSPLRGLQREDLELLLS